MQKETQLIKQILDYCRYRNLLFYRTQAGAVKTDRGGFVKFGEKGVSDITGCLPNGKYVACEVKVGKNKMQPSQKDFEQRVLKNGGQYWLVYSLDEFIAKL